MQFAKNYIKNFSSELVDLIISKIKLSDSIRHTIVIILINFILNHLNNITGRNVI